MRDLRATDLNISSAEMTAYWRSKYPHLSGDKLSIKLASDAGIHKAYEFEEKYNYPLVGRKVSVRAGFFLKQAVDLLLTQKFDACISFASGFSLLNYSIAMAVQKTMPNVVMIDTDLPSIINERLLRIEKISDDLRQDILSRLKCKIFDLEEAASNGSSLKELFPECHSPIFIIEGVIYFLSQQCVDWIFSEISKFPNAAVIVDYWPEDGIQESECFSRVVQSLKGFIPENIKSFLDQESLGRLYQNFHSVNDVSIQYVEHQYSIWCDESPQFTDQNQFFPVRFLVAQK